MCQALAWGSFHVQIRRKCPVCGEEGNEAVLGPSQCGVTEGLDFPGDRHALSLGFCQSVANFALQLRDLAGFIEDELLLERFTNLLASDRVHCAQKQTVSRKVVSHMADANLAALCIVLRRPAKIALTAGIEETQEIPALSHAKIRLHDHVLP